jgi:hypothetical protein
LPVAAVIDIAVPDLPPNAARRQASELHASGGK